MKLTRRDGVVALVTALVLAVVVVAFALGKASGHAAAAPSPAHSPVAATSPVRATPSPKPSPSHTVTPKPSLTPKPSVTYSPPSPSPTWSPPSPDGPLVYFYDCQGNAVPAPSEIVLACADSNMGVSGIQWTNWNTTQAVGYGTAYQNTCSPSCAAGSNATSPVTVTLSGWTNGSTNTFQTMTISGATGLTADLNGQYALKPNGEACNLAQGGC
jgi:hypothetical protein